MKRLRSWAMAAKPRLAGVALIALLAACRGAGREGDPVPRIAAPEQLDSSGDEIVGAARACSRKESRACLGLGIAYARGLRVTADPKRAEELLVGLCEEGQALACRELGALEQKNDPEPSKAHYVRAAGLLRDRCEEGTTDGVACFMLAELFAEGRGTKQDLTRAEALTVRARDKLTSACKQGRGPACYYLARALEHGIGLEIDTDRAASLFDEACKDGYQGGCFAVFSELDPRRKQTPESKAKIKARLRLGCEKGAASLCGVLAWSYSDSPEESKAARIRACALDEADACRTLGSEGDAAGAADARKKAESLFDEACTLGIATACQSLSELVRPASRERAAAARKRAVVLDDGACDLDDFGACLRAGTAHARGLGVAPSLEAAARRYAKACRSGIDFACQESFTSDEAKFAARPVHDLLRLPGRLLAFAQTSEHLVIAIDDATPSPCQGAHGSARLVRIVRAGGAPETLAEGLCSPVALARSGNRLAWIDQEGALSSCEGAPCKPEAWSPKGVKLEPPLVSSGGSFVAFEREPERRLARLEATAISTVAKLDAAPAGLASKGEDVVWSEAARGDVRRVLHGNAPSLVIHVDEPPGAIALLTNDPIVVLPKSGDLLRIRGSDTQKIAFGFEGATLLATSDDWIFGAKPGTRSDEYFGAQIVRAELDGYAPQRFFAVLDGAPVGIAADPRCVIWAYAGDDGQSGIQEACEP